MLFWSITTHQIYAKISTTEQLLNNAGQLKAQIEIQVI